MVKTFRDLIVWQKGHKLVLDVYCITKDFPKEERYGLASQLRRSVISIPTNIAEGFKRKSKKDFAHFINMAEGSLEETKYHILLAKDLDYIKNDVFMNLSSGFDEIGRMLCSFHRKLLM